MFVFVAEVCVLVLGRILTKINDVSMQRLRNEQSEIRKVLHVVYWGLVDGVAGELNAR